MGWYGYKGLRLQSCCCLVLVVLLVACVAKKKTSGNQTDPNNLTLEDLTPAQQQAIPNDNSPGGSTGSDEPFPLVCSITARDYVAIPATQVASCPQTIGNQVPPTDFEGFCFVKDNVTPAYQQNPPTSGPAYKNPEWKWYEHDTAVARGRYVHNLAHGFVVFAYNCPQGCAEEVDKLVQIRKDPKYAGLRLLITPDPLVEENTFFALAWNWLYKSESVDKTTFACFLLQHVSENLRYVH